ncbi:M4 family metallopeptidase [Candidatus Amoebophilus asiaticus]|nr:M4 family metallopeptidase [Candidatus Amoebophilus asiaticus]
MLCALHNFALAEVLQDGQANKKIAGSEFIWYDNNFNVPCYIRLSKDKVIPVNELELWLRNVLQFRNEDELRLLRIENDQLGFTNYRFEQFYKNYPVVGGVYIAHIKNNKVISVNGEFFDDLHVNTSKQITEQQALNSALRSIGARVYKWQFPEEERHIKLVTNDPSATYFPKGMLVIAPVNGVYGMRDFRLAYKFDVYAHEPLSRNYVYVEVITGKVIWQSNRIHTDDAVGVAETRYSGTQSMITDSTGTEYRLRETGRGGGIETYDMNEGTSYGGSVDFTDTDNYWNNVNAEQDEVATDAHWGAEMTYDYFWNVLGRNSYDNNGAKLLSYVHYSSNYSNAFWDGQRMTYGDGSGSYNPFTAIDVCGHEITHGVTQYTADLVYQNESGALSESFSDIFGACIEFYGVPDSADWLIGEDLKNDGTALRSMDDPNSYGDPDTYLGTFWYTGSGDNGGVHTNSGVQNFWFYLLSTGGSGTNDLGNAYTVNGIGLTAAAQIAYRNLSVYLTSTSEYADARFYSIQAAIDLFGACTPEVEAVANAWYAVGIGPAYDATVTSDFVADQTVSCLTPFTVNFTNQSNYADSFYWDFGDGDTSTAISPTHTYSDYGNFTISLIASGGACGTDTMIKITYISVDTANACIVNMPTSGTGQTQTACAGKVYDSGGPGSNYQDLTNGVLTISPTSAATITLTFLSFDFEANYDYLYVYDGPNTSSPLIGSYTGTSLPNGGTIISSGGSITLRQYSDTYVNEPGFEVDWLCTYPSTPPVADFTAKDTASCSGEIFFTDLSTNGPNAWLWDFGDSFTSTQQNPSHIYLNSGIYNVQLIASNSYGNDTVIKNSYVSISKPAAPVTNDTTVCKNDTVTINVNGNGTINWYDDSLRNNLVYTGNNYKVSGLTTATTFYVEDVITEPSQFVGPTSNAIGGGGNFSSSNRHLIFNVDVPAILVSTLVYAQGDQFRQVELRDKNGTVLQDTTIFISDGSSRIYLNFELLPGDSLQLGTSGTADLFRNSDGTAYPYTLPGILSIIGANAPSGYYYFFYDWEIKEPECISELSPMTVNVYPGPTATITIDSVLCNNVTLSAGAANSYLWSTGDSSQSITVNTSANYSVTVSDTINCSATVDTNISVSSGLTLFTGKTDATCGDANGTAIVSVTGGSVYTYSWSNGATTNNLNNLIAGLYTITVKDENGCTELSAFAINDISGPSIIVNDQADVTCFGMNDGSLVVSISGGSSPVNYYWSNGDSSTALSNLAPGSYTITVIDENACADINVLVINEPAQLASSVNKTDNTCYSSCDGTTDLTITGGITPYVFWWNNGVNTEDQSGLCAGTYTVTIDDVNGCSIMDTVVILEPTMISTSKLSNDVSCNGAGDGNIDLSVVGGSTPYSFNWSNNQTTEDISSLSGGMYVVTITDNDGCIVIDNTIISEPDSLTLFMSSTPETQNNNDGTATVSVTGGTTPYFYKWDDPQSQTTSTATNLSSGNYLVNVTDNNGCSASATVNVSKIEGVADIISSGLVQIYPNPSSGKITIEIPGQAWDDAEIVIYNILGELMLTKKILSAQLELDLSNYPPGIYFVEVVVEQDAVIKKFVLY